MNFIITDEIKKRDKDEIFNALIKYNLSKIEDKNPKDLGVYYEDSDGHKLAGLIAQTHGNWLTVEFLWVSKELRGNNIGLNLLKSAEAEAKQRGCKYAFLDTFAFQAPGFYKKQGYKEAFVLENYPLTGKRFYFTKEL